MNESQQHGSLLELLPTEWLENQDFGFTMYRLYSTILEKEDLDRAGPIFTKLKQVEFKHPVKCSPILLYKQELEEMRTKIFFQKSENLTLVGKSDSWMFEIPEGIYFFLFSPIQVVEGTSNEGEPTDALDRAVGWIASLVGKSTLCNLVLEGRISDKDGKQHFTSDSVEQPSGAWSFRPIFQEEELQKLIDSSNEEFVASSLLFLGRAIHETETPIKFALYWIALEVACGGKEQKIVQTLSAQSGVSVADLRSKFWDRIRNRRHDLLHRGQLPELEPFEERLMQLMCVDLIAARLGIDQISAVKQYLNMPELWPEA